MKLEDRFKQLNNALTESIINSCKNKKKILLTLTAGMDTRLVLSICLNNNIRPDVITYDGWSNFGIHKDINVSKKIARDYNLNHIIINKQPSDIGWSEDVKTVVNAYDAVLYGELMSEVFNKYNRITESERKLNTLIVNFMHRVGKENNNRRFYPVLDEKVRAVVDELPLYCRMQGYIQRKLIRINHKKLLKYSHTTYNLKYRLLEYIYRVVIGIYETTIRIEKEDKT